MTRSIPEKLILDQYLIFKSFETSVIGITFALILFFFSLSGIHHHRLGLKNYQKPIKIEYHQNNSATLT
jgi:hypothetical protein